MRHLFTTLLVLVILPLSISAQQIHSCGTTPFSEGFELQTERLIQNIRRAAEGVITTRNTSYVPIKFHVGARADGSGRLSAQSVLDQLCELNEDFAPIDIQFFLADGTINFINNTNFYENHIITQNNVMSSQRDPRAMNVYIVENANTDGGDDGVTLAYYNIPRDWIVITKTFVRSNDATLSHEIGHFFSLLHTFNGWECGGYNTEDVPAPATASCGNIATERANGTNCETAGDRLCDTPADFNNGFGWNNCSFTLNVLDPQGNTITPDERNYLGYFLDCPDDEYYFSNQQIEAMEADLASVSRNFLRLDPVPDYVEIDSESTNISPEQSETYEAYNNVEFVWEEVPGATSYVLEIDRISSFSLNPVRLVTSGTSVIVNELDPERLYYWRVRPFNAHFTCTSNSDITSFRTGTGAVSTTTPSFVESFTVAPNPVLAQNELQIQLSTEKAFTGQIDLLDINGRSTNIREQHQFAIGQQRFTIELSDLPNGIYLLRMQTQAGSITQKVVLAR